MISRLFLIISLAFNSLLAFSSIPNNELRVDLVDKYRQILQNVRAIIVANPDSAEQLLNQHKYFYTTTDDIALRASYYNRLALINQFKSNVTVALPNYLQSLKLFESINDSININVQFSGIGACYMVMSQYLQAKRYLTKALHFAEKVNDSTIFSNACINLSFIHVDNNEYNIAEEYLRKAISFSKSDFQRGRATNNLGEIFIKKNQLKDAILTFRKALTYSSKAKDQLMISMEISNIGYVKMMQNELDSASYFFNQIVMRYPAHVEEYLMANTYSHYAKLSMMKYDFAKAIAYTDISTQIAQRNRMAKIVSENNIWLSKRYSDQGDYRKAYELQLLGVVLKDSLFNEAKSKQINELEAIYQSEAKQSKINLLDAQNTASQLRLRNNTLTISALSIGIVLVILFAMLLFRQHKLKAGMSSQMLEHKLLRTQMNPHFIFNSLVAIQSFLNSQSPVAVYGYIGKFSRLMRLILDNSRNNFISIETEVETLGLYLELQKMRFSDNFSYSIILPNDSDFLDNMIPPMIAQPFVENAIEHGFLRSERGGVLLIRFYESDGCICCEVEDNGVGIRESKQDKRNSDHKSLATEITKERLTLFSKKGKPKGSLNIEDLLQTGKSGTLVTIKIPI